MRRIRRISPGLPAAFSSRMSAAFALSIAFHVFLIFGFSLAPDAGPGTRTIVVHARLISLPAAPIARRAKTAKRDGVVDSLPPAPKFPPAMAPKIDTETLAALVPTPSPRGPEPDASAISETRGPTIPDPTHYPAMDLDIYPQAIRRITPAYPEAVRSSGVAGSVTLLVMIDEAGKVVGTSVRDASPEGVFDQAAQEALASALFYPARKDGRVVRSRVLIRVEFDPETMFTAH